MCVDYFTRCLVLWLLELHVFCNMCVFFVTCMYLHLLYVSLLFCSYFVLCYFDILPVLA
jgi:hypothetical protein